MMRRIIVRTAFAGAAALCAAAIAWATEPACVSDANACSGNYVLNGSGCSTYTNPDPPFYPECCQYWQWRCAGTQTTWIQRSGWTFGEACGGPPNVCPSWANQTPPGGDG